MAVDIAGDLRTVKAALRAAGVPANLIGSIETRALRTPRRITGPWPTNRQTRWSRVPEHPDYAPQDHCQIICIRLLGTLMEFDGAPDIDANARVIVERYLGRPMQPGQYRDPLTLEKLSYALVIAEAAAPVHGHSSIHIGHREPARVPKHHPDNIDWRYHRSNMIQGNQTLEQARTWVVEIIARYFGLGEVRLERD